MSMTDFISIRIGFHSILCMQRQHSSQATSTLGNTPNLNIGSYTKGNPYTDKVICAGYATDTFICALPNATVGLL